jgi:hypothetical protein
MSWGYDSEFLRHLSMPRVFHYRFSFDFGLIKGFVLSDLASVKPVFYHSNACYICSSAFSF